MLGFLLEKKNRMIKEILGGPLILVLLIFMNLCLLINFLKNIYLCLFPFLHVKNLYKNIAINLSDSLTHLVVWWFGIFGNGFVNLKFN